VLVILPSPISELQHTLLPPKVLRARECALTPFFSIVFSLDSHLIPLRSPGVRHKLSRTQEIIRIKAKKRFKSSFQTRNKTTLCDSKTKPQNVMINVKTNLYYVNVCKHEHENNLIRLWCIMSKTSVEQIKGNEGSYSYLYPFGN
jgi:hypothetical protein